MRRAPRAVRRGRKFKSRPTSHDGLTVIAAYGNLAGYDLDGKVVGRQGNTELVCRDGTVLSVLAGVGAKCLPAPVFPPMSWGRPLRGAQVRADYRGPYYAVEVAFDNTDRRVLAPMPDGWHVWPQAWISSVRTLIDLHGGFARMRQPPAHARLLRRSEAQNRARYFGEMAREAASTSRPLRITRADDGETPSPEIDSSPDRVVSPDNG